MFQQASPVGNIRRSLFLILGWAATCAEVRADLLWYSPLDGNADAVTGASGVLMGNGSNPSAVEDRNGSSSSAIDFSGTERYYEIAADPEVDAFTEATISAWVRVSASGGDGDQGFVAIGETGGGSTEYFSFMRNDTDSLRGDLDDGTQRRAVSTGVTPDTWHHVSFTWSGGGVYRLYLDGVEVSTSSLAGRENRYNNLGPWLLGTERTNLRFVNGAIDELGIWDDELSARRVAAIHGLSKFQDINLNDPVVDSVVNLSTPGQTVVIGEIIWEYVDDLNGETGTTGGTVAGENAFIVLDGDNDLGIRMEADPAVPPVITNGSSSNLGPSSVTLSGQVTDTGGEDPVVTIYYGDNNGGTTAGSWDHSVNLGAQAEAFSIGLTGLTPETTHFFRCFAANSAGSDWADSSGSFTTAPAPNPPTVVNDPAGNVIETQGDARGSVTNTGGETPQVTLYFGASDGGTDPGAWDESVNLGAQSASFSSTFFFLTHNSTYYYRAFAENSGGSAWAPSSASFTTLAFMPPEITQSGTSAIGSTVAEVEGEVTATGGNAPTVTIYFGEVDGGTEPEAWDESVTIGEQSSTFSAVLTNLLPATTCYFRAYAENLAGSDWADSTESFVTVDASDLVINEFMAANDGGETNNPNDWYPIANQVEGTTDDWIELHNSSSSQMNLGGWHLTDDAGDLNKWTFPFGTTIAAGEYLIVYASGEGQPDANGNFHTGFGLSASGEFLALVRPNLTIASSFGTGGADYPEQDNDVSYGLHPISQTPVYFSSPTPGEANDPNGLAKVGSLTFSHARGYYQTAIDVTITAETEEATIYFTTDGMPPIDDNGDPTGTASEYSTPVELTRTTVLRAAAVLGGQQSSPIETRSYVLLDIDQAGTDGTDPAGLNTPFLQQSRPAGWGDLSSGDFNMDTRVSQSTETASGHATSTAQTMLKGMRDIPTISIAIDRDDFSGDDGIYSNSFGRGFAWERLCSAEFLPAEGGELADWQEDCGLRVQGGASRNPDSSPKHSLSFRFRKEYGSGKLREKVFPGSAVEEFNVLVLRAGYNNSWIHRADSQRDRASMIRDQFARESMIDMGNPSAGHGYLVHVFVNGLYWGVHNLCERQDASHYASYNGGDEDDLDARNGSSTIDGDEEAWDEVADVVATGVWEDILKVIDIDHYIDFQILQRYIGNGDLKSGGNWRAAGGGGGPYPPDLPTDMAPWQLYSWDAEQILTSGSSTTVPLDPLGVRDALELLPEYRVRFADHVQKHFFNDGALTHAKSEARWMQHANDIDRAIIAESARWGDHLRDDPYTRDAEWLSEQSRLLTDYFPGRTAFVLNEIKDAGLYPEAEAPVFAVNSSPQHGGEIPAGGTLAITSPDGTIYYTTDGSDPRLEDGSVNPSAATTSSGAALPFTASGLLRARVLDGGNWSALEQANFFLEPLAGFGDLAISEIHYHPTGPTLGEQQADSALPDPQTFTDEDFEFLEIENLSGQTINLAGVRLSGGISCEVPNHPLAPGTSAVVVSNPEAFLTRYPGLEGSIAGSFSANLSNDGEELNLIASDDTLLASFTYNDAGSWPGRADGSGSSLELLAVGLDPNDSESWRSSSEYNGSPGAVGGGEDGRVVINEVMTHPGLTAVDAIELHNPGGSSVTLTGWYLSDSDSPVVEYRAFAIPPTTLQPGQYVTFHESDFHPMPTRAIASYSGTPAASPTTITSASHGLSDGEVISVEDYGGIGKYNGTFEVDVLDADRFTIDTPFLDNDAARGSWISGRPFGLSAGNGETLYLIEADASGQPLRFVDVVSFAAAREGETLGRWPDGAGNGTLVTMTADTLGTTNAPAKVGPVIISEFMYQPSVIPENHFEFVEICNAGVVTENLNHWRSRGGVDFDFDSSHELAPGESLVLVGFDPVGDPTTATSFRSHYGIDGSVQLVGPWTDGPLRNDSGTLRLQRPGTPSLEDPTDHPQVTEDAVTYFASSPWPEDGAGDGLSLHRTSATAFGEFFTSWTGGSPTPGDKDLAATTYDDFQTAAFGPGQPPNSGPEEDYESDGIANLVEYALGTNPLVADTGRLPRAILVGDNLTLTFPRNTKLSDITIFAQYSSDLEEWFTATDSLLSSEDGIEIRQVSMPTSSSTQLFLRLRVVQTAAP